MSLFYLHIAQRMSLLMSSKHDTIKILQLLTHGRYINVSTGLNDILINGRFCYSRFICIYIIMEFISNVQFFISDIKNFYFLFYMFH